MPKQVQNGLSPAAARIFGPGRYADGNGLYLAVTDTGARMWIWRGVIQGRRRELGLGSTAYVSLKDAREKARNWKRIAHEGGDPVAVRDQLRRAQLTFGDAAKRCWSARVDGKVRSDRTSATWLNPVETYASPRLGKKTLSSVTTADVAAVLAPIWLEKPETGRKVRQRLRMIFDWARASGHLDGSNPVEGVNLALPRQTDRKQHFAALPWKDLPLLWPRLMAARGLGALALRYTILTSARTGEARGATWSEIDLEGKLWTIPASRMKTERPHRVPLSPAALDVLEIVRPLKSNGDALVFPSSRPNRPLSDMTVSAVLKRLEVPVTVHGFRSTFRDWAEDETSYSHEVKEAALAHVVKSRVEAAYRRTDLFERRRALMADWASFVTGG